MKFLHLTYCCVLITLLYAQGPTSAALLQVGRRFPLGIQVGGENATCMGVEDVGLLRFDSEQGVLSVCNGTEWSSASEEAVEALNTEVRALRDRVDELEVQSGSTLVGVQICHNRGFFDVTTRTCNCECDHLRGCWDPLYLCERCSSGWEGDRCQTDTVPPEIHDCPSAIFSPTEMVSWTEPTATDNFVVASMVSNFSPGAIFPPGTTVVEYVASDEQGLQSVCTFDVTVDLEDPEWSDCENGSVYTISTYPGENVGYFEYVHPLGPQASDNEGVYSVETSDAVSSPSLQIGVHEMVFTAYDRSGRSRTCSFTVVVKDFELPEFHNCPDDFAVSAGSGYVTWDEPSVSDNDNVSSITASALPGQLNSSDLAIGLNLVQYSAVDLSGNHAVCSFFLRYDMSLVALNGAFALPNTDTLSSCESYRLYGHGDGFYWINPSGNPGGDEKVFCRFVDGFGWTSFGRFREGNTVSTHIGLQTTGNPTVSNQVFSQDLSRLGPVKYIHAEHLRLGDSREWTVQTEQVISLSGSSYETVLLEGPGDDSCTSMLLSWHDGGCWSGRKAGPAIGVTRRSADATSCTNTNNWVDSVSYMYGRGETAGSGCFPGAQWNSLTGSGETEGEQMWSVRPDFDSDGFSSCSNVFVDIDASATSAINVTWPAPVLSSAANDSSLVSSHVSGHNEFSRGKHVVVHSVQVPAGQSYCFTEVSVRSVSTLISYDNSAIELQHSRDPQLCDGYRTVLGEFVDDGLYVVRGAGTSQEVACKTFNSHFWTRFARFRHDYVPTSHLGYSTFSSGDNAGTELSSLGPVSHVLASHVKFSMPQEWQLDGAQTVSVPQNNWHPVNLVGTGFDGCSPLVLSWHSGGCWNGRIAGPSISTNGWTSSNTLCGSTNNWEEGITRSYGRNDADPGSPCVPGSQWNSLAGETTDGIQEWFVR